MMAPVEMRVAVLHERLNSNFVEAIARLRDGGVHVDLMVPGAAIDVTRVRVEHDLYVIKGSNAAVMCVAGALHAAGARTLNPFPIVARLKQKPVVARELAAAGLPVPETWIANDATELEPMLRGGAVVVKPWDGSRGRGVRTVRRADELAEAGAAAGSPVMAQRAIEGDGRDRKLYVLGDRVFGVLRRWPAATEHEKRGEPFVPSAMLTELALRCGHVYGLTMYGLDVIVDRDERPWIVDVNKCPGYLGVPDAPALIAAHVSACARV
jgi:ribosomal protein S6--L-glutamate ligase